MNTRTRAAWALGVVLVVAVLVLVWQLEAPRGGGEAGVVTGASRDVPGTVVPEGRASAALPETLDTTPTGLEVEPAPEPATAPAEREPELVIRGRVLAPDDTPVEGATLVLSRDKDAPPLDIQVSDAEGRFRFDVHENPEDARRLTVTAEGFAWMSLGGGGTWSEEEFDVRLHWTAPVSGVVRDAETGAPVAHARVSSGGEPVETASDGSYSLDGVTVGWDSGVTVEHDDYARKTVTFLLSDPEPVEVDVELERGLAVECTVVDRESGEPVPGAEIRRHVGGEPFAQADGGGRFTLRLSDAEEHASLTVVHPEYCPLIWSWTGGDVVPGLAPRLPLGRPAWIDARIVDADGQLVDGAGVYASHGGFPRHALPEETRDAFGVPGRVTDADPYDTLPGLDEVPGEVSVPVVPWGEDYRLHAYHEDYVSAESGPLELRLPESRAAVELVLLRGGAITGRLTRGGEPVEFEEVRCDDPAEGYLGRAITSPKGEFRIENLRAGEVRLTVPGSTRGEVLYEARLTVEAGVELAHDIALEADALSSLEGRVTWMNGEPAVGKGVVARFAGERSGRAADYAETDETGTYQLEVPAEGAYDVVVTHVTEVRRDNVPAGSREVDFVLPPIATLSLVLRDAATGEPVQVGGSRYTRRWLSWRAPGEERFRTLTSDIDIHGRAELEVPAGVVDLAIDLESDGYVPVRLPGVPAPELPSARPLEVFLERGAEVAFRFVEAATGEGARPADHLVYVVPEAKHALIREPVDGENSYRINGVRVVIEDPELSGRRLSLSEAGAGEQRGLEPGRYLLVAFPPDLALEPASFGVPRAGEGPLTVRWGPLGG